MKYSLFLLFLFCAISTAKSESFVYVFDTFDFTPSEITINGEKINIPERPVKKEDIFTYLKKSVTKLIFPNEGNILFVRDMEWAKKFYHDELPIDLVDGETYYIKNISGMKSKIKMLTEKEGKKLLEKAQKDTNDWIINDDITIEN